MTKNEAEGIGQSDAKNESEKKNDHSLASERTNSFQENNTTNTALQETFRLRTLQNLSAPGQIREMIGTQENASEQYIPVGRSHRTQSMHQLPPQCSNMCLVYR